MPTHIRTPDGVDLPVFGDARLAGKDADTDVRRFRPNIVVRTTRTPPFGENDWVGGLLSFGTAADAPTVAVTMRDERCAMLNLNPISARPEPEFLKAVVRANENNAGVYGTVARAGVIAVGQPVFLRVLG